MLASLPIVAQGRVAHADSMLRASVTIAGVPDGDVSVNVAASFATGLHQVDNPVFDRDGHFTGYRGIEGAVLATMRSIPSWPLKRSFVALGRSGLPVLLFWGREDATLPFEQSSRLLDCLPGAEFHAVEGAGHVPHWEKAEEVNEAVLEFLHRAMSM